MVAAACLRAGGGGSALAGVGLGASGSRMGEGAGIKSRSARWLAGFITMGDFALVQGACRVADSQG